MSEPTDFVILGRLGTVYGVRGWLRLHSFTDPPPQIFDYSGWHICHQRQWITLTLTAFKPHGDTFIVKFAEITDREQARSYANNEIAVDRSALPETNTDEFYCHDLMGLSVVTTAGKSLGKVIDIQATGANDVFIVKGEKRHLIPYIESVVQDINLTTQTITVEWDDAF